MPEDQQGNTGSRAHSLAGVEEDGNWTVPSESTESEGVAFLQFSLPMRLLDVITPLREGNHDHHWRHTISHHACVLTLVRLVGVALALSPVQMHLQQIDLDTTWDEEASGYSAQVGQMMSHYND